MFGGGFNSGKLKTNLRLCINRLKLLQKKKTEINVKHRKEIASYLADSKDDRARIKVEHIIRDDYIVEAMEAIELYCDLLLARIGLIESQKWCDEGLSTPVCTLIWVAPRMMAEVSELKAIASLLEAKFGKEFANQARNNTNGAVNPRVKSKITLQQPSPVLVENYLIEIARTHNIPFEPNQELLMGSDYLGGDGYNDNNGGGGDGGGGNVYNPPPAPGFSSFEDFVSGPPRMDPPPLPRMNNPPANMSAGDNTSQGVSSMPGSTTHPPGKEIPAPQPPGAYSAPPGPGQNNIGPSVPSLPQVPTSDAPPSYNQSFELPHLPSVPSDSLPSAGGSEDADFDDLNRRFEELRKRK